MAYFGKLAIRCSTLALALGMATAAHGQVAGAPVVAEGSSAQAPEHAEGEALGDIVVTAEKRPSTAQRTPIALSVIDSETLARNGVGNLTDAAALLPSVSFATVQAAAIVSIRGVSSRDTTEIGDPAVSIAIDGFYLQRAIGLNASIFDLDRVEALRGPQGTLLGRNATGGAINIITAKPTREFAASATGELGSYGMYNTQGMINLPVSDRVQVRASFQTRDRNGYRDNPVGRDGDDEHSKAARLHVAVQPTDRWNILLTGEYSHLSGVGPVFQAVPQVRANGAVVVNVRPDIPGDGKTFSVPDGGYIRATAYNVRWNTDYDLGFATIAYLGGYRDLDFRRHSALGGAYGSARQNFTFDQHESPKTWNHELRLTSQNDGPFVWQAGLYHFRESNPLTTYFQDYRGQDDIQGTASNLQIYSYPTIVAKSSAAFGQASYALDSRWKVEAGIRYTEDDKRRVGFNSVTNINTFVTTGAISYVTTQQSSQTSSNKTTYHGALNFQATPRNLLYAKIDTGYKTGGFTDLNEYGPETITAYEIGSKNRFFDNRLQFNLDAFLYDYRDQQISQQVTTAAGTIANETVNAGKSRFYGVEADMSYLVTPADRLDAYVGYLHAEFTDFLTVVSGRNVQLAGNRLPQAPRWSINAGYQHEFALGGGTLTPRIQTHAESKTYFTFYNYQADSQRAYERSDILLTYTAPRRKWSLEGYVRNIEDRLILANAQDPSSTTYLAYRYQYQAPRTYGARLTVNW